MDYLTRQLLLELIKLREAHEEQNARENTVQERNRKQQKINYEAFRQFLSRYEESVRNNAVSECRQHRIQKSIRNATWAAAFCTFLAFIAAGIYACVTYGQWQTAKDALEAQNRPWIGIDSDITVTEISLTQEAIPSIVGQIEYSVKNYGPSPAIRVGIDFSFNDRMPRRPTPDLLAESCKRADEQSRRPSSTDTAQFRSIFPHESLHLRDNPNPTPVTNRLKEVILPPGFLVGCISYRYGNPEFLYHTTVIYKLFPDMDHTRSERGFEYFPIGKIQRLDTEAD